MTAWLAWMLLVPQPATITLLRSADANEWLEAADQHQPGADDKPLTKIAGWSGGRLMRALSVVREESPSDELNARLERAALLHADISLLSRDTGDPPSSESWALGGEALLVQDGRRVGRHTLDPHIAFGRRIFGAMRPPAPGVGRRPDPASERARIRAWQAAHARNPRIRQRYRALSADFASRHWLADLQPHLADAHGALTDDAGHHFDAGCLAELLASAQVQHVVPQVAPSAMNRKPLHAELDVLALSEGFNLSEAEKEYRDALKIDPSYDEARVRLARLLTLKDRPREALALLAPAIASPESTVRYYGLLVVADARELDGRAGEARAAYAQAAEMFPLAQSAIIPMIRLSRELGDDAGARYATARMAALPRGEGRRDDPWWFYYDCNGRHRDREVEALWRLCDREQRQ